MSSSHIGVFKGDSDGLVDKLVAACQQRPAAGGYTGFGRELVPCPMSWMEEPLPARAADGANRRQAPKKHARSSGSGRAPGSPEHKAKKLAPAAPAGGFACPAFASSPKPEAVPMPTSSLMSRALARGRSPSPGKQASPVYAAMPPMRLQAVAA